MGSVVEEEHAENTLNNKANVGARHAVPSIAVHNPVNLTDDGVVMSSRIRSPLRSVGTRSRPDHRPLSFVIAVAASWLIATGLTYEIPLRAEPMAATAAVPVEPAPVTPLFERGIRGVTIGPIESSLQSNRGYGSAPFQRTLQLIERMDGNWVSLTPFGRIWDLEPSGVDQRFEAPAQQTATAIAQAVAQAHARGLKVLIVPHLWAETGEWRGEIDPKTDADWRRWAVGYRRFMLSWAKVAAAANADLFAVGVELRSWVTTTHAPSFVELIHEVRRVYSGPLTYAANWDDVHDTVIWGELDVIALNAFFPLAEQERAPFDELLAASEKLSVGIRELSQRWGKPVVFNEIGYTTRPDPALRPWEWPDSMKNVVVDQRSQADAYRALLAPFLDEPWFMGFFVWRWYADPYDMSQEAEWGFSPFGKQAELVLRDAFATPWVADTQPSFRYQTKADRVGLY
jgi:hypothetical protein